jgi:tetratricopeptide (TPR) repeat protein
VGRLSIAILLVVVLLTVSVITGCDPAGARLEEGDEFYEQGLLDEAIEKYTAAIRIEPTFDAPYYRRAIAYAEQGKKAEAIADFEKFIPLSEEGPWNRPEWIEMAKQQIEELSR